MRFVVKTERIRNVSNDELNIDIERPKFKHAGDP